MKTHLFVRETRCLFALRTLPTLSRTARVVQNNTSILIHMTIYMIGIDTLLQAVQFDQRVGELFVQFERFVFETVQFVFEFVIATVQFVYVFVQNGYLVFQLFVVKAGCVKFLLTFCN